MGNKTKKGLVLRGDLKQWGRWALKSYNKDSHMDTESDL